MKNAYALIIPLTPTLGRVHRFFSSHLTVGYTIFFSSHYMAGYSAFNCLALGLRYTPTCFRNYIIYDKSENVNTLVPFFAKKFVQNRKFFLLTILYAITEILHTYFIPYYLQSQTLFKIFYVFVGIMRVSARKFLPYILFFKV